MVVEQKAFEVPAAGGTVTVKVKANTDYTYTIDASSQSWITETTTRALTEYTHIFKVDANDQYDSRQGTITFKSTKTGETDQVTITQDALLGMIVEQKAFEVAETGGSITVTVKANTEYDYIISESCKEWITESTTRGLTRTHRRHHLPGYEDRHDGGSAGQAGFEGGHFPGVRDGTGGAHGHLQCPGRAELGIPRVLGYGSAGHLVAEYPV